MIDAIDGEYFEIIFEEDYLDDNWMKHGFFKRIDFYDRIVEKLKNGKNQ